MLSPSASHCVAQHAMVEPPHLVLHVREEEKSAVCVKASDLHALIAGMASQLSNCCTSNGSGVLLGHCLPCGNMQDS